MIEERAATAAERALLDDLLAGVPGRGRRWRAVVEEGVVLWAAGLLGITIAWLLLAWPIRRVFDVEVGLRSAASPWILGIAAAVVAVFAVRSNAGSLRRGSERGDALRADVAAGRVVEERHRFTAARRFEEQEHGGLIYFLRANDGRAFTLYDRESQDLGAAGEDPTGSRFKPMSALTIVRAPQSGDVLRSGFSGEPLDAGEPIELAVDPDHWPEPDQYCAIPWDGLEARFGPGPGERQDRATSRSSRRRNP